MALGVAAILLARPDLYILSCTWADGDTTGTLANGNILHFTFRDNGGALVAPVSVMAQLNTQAALSSGPAAVVAGVDVVCSKLAGAGGTGAASAFTLYIHGPRSKFIR